MHEMKIDEIAHVSDQSVMTMRNVLIIWYYFSDSVQPVRFNKTDSKQLIQQLVCIKNAH